MSENSEQAVTEQQEALQPLSHKRIYAEMAAVVVVSAVVSFIFVSAAFGFGVIVGGILSLINYYWLKHSLRRIFDAAHPSEPPRFLATKYFLRYLVFGAILAVVYLTKAVPVVAVLLGLASFAFAIVIEAFIRLFSSFFNKKEI
ncbi:MAG TPA: ATP synthase subunit I [Pyrinomonadaceae bacterium]|jgi:hypothetical protein